MRKPSALTFMSALCLWGAVVLSTSCGDTEAQRFCIELAASRCAFIYDCCNPIERDELGLASFAHTDREECIAVTEPVLCAEFSQLVDAEESERMEADADALDELLAQQKEATETCEVSTFFEVEIDTASLWTGIVSEGGVCFATEECASDTAVCQRGRNPDVVSAEGVCTNAPGLDEPCAGFLCGPELVCRSGTCIAKPILGESCLFVNCQTGLVCGPGDRCFEQVGRGEACQQDVQCFSNQCDAGACVGGPPLENAAFDICEGLPE